ncbi:MAG: glycosyltransferase family 8 protein [Nanoarchaeota archaeon]|nr:glycosyltransferase family 8 protein [Nanoarchaeota archaeon]
MKNNSINIGTIADENYAQHTGVWMFSIMKNCSCSSDIHFYIFDGGINEKSKKLMKKICDDFGSKLSFIKPDVNDWLLFKGLKLGKHLTPIIYCKLLFAEKIKNIEKIIILDSDIIVEGDIKELNEISLDNKTIGAIPDVGIYTKEISAKNLGFPDNQKYFNSGVMVVDCVKWKKNNVLKNVIKFIRENPDKIRIQDQDGLNFIMQKDWKALPYEWNIVHPFYYKSLELKKVIGEKKLNEILANPKIVHYTIKPWIYEKVHPLRNRYWHYLKQTPWKNAKYPKITLKGFILKLFRLIIKPIPWETKLKIKSIFSRPSKNQQEFRYLSEEELRNFKT